MRYSCIVPNRRLVTTDVNLIGKCSLTKENKRYNVIGINYQNNRQKKNLHHVHVYILNSLK